MDHGCLFSSSNDSLFLIYISYICILYLCFKLCSFNLYFIFVFWIQISDCLFSALATTPSSSSLFQLQPFTLSTTHRLIPTAISSEKKVKLCWDRRERIGKPSASCRPPTPGQIHLLLTPLDTCGSSRIGRPALNRVWSGCWCSIWKSLQCQVPWLLARQFARVASLFICCPSSSFGPNPLHGQVEQHTKGRSPKK